MTPNIPPDVLALAREIAAKYDRANLSGTIEDYAFEAAIAAIMEVTERAARLSDEIMGVNQPSVFGGALRNMEHLK